MSRYEAVIEGEAGREEFKTVAGLCAALEARFNGFAFIRAGTEGEHYTIGVRPDGRLGVCYSEAWTGEPVSVTYAALPDAVDDLYQNLRDRYEKTG